MAEYHIGQKIWPAKTKLNDGSMSDTKVDITTELLPLPVKNVIKLGITTIPGVKFIFNNGQEMSNNKTAEVEIGRTGFFELDLKGLGMTINSIMVADADSATAINENYCYIDYIYEKQGGASS